MNRLRRHGLSVILVLAGLAIALSAWGQLRQANTTATNCRVVKTLTRIEAEFLRTDAIDKAGALTASEKAQVIRAFDKIFVPKELTKLSDKQQALDAKTIDYWQHVLEPDAKSLARSIGCA